MPKFANTAPKRVGPKPKVPPRLFTPYQVRTFLSWLTQPAFGGKVVLSNAETHTASAAFMESCRRLRAGGQVEVSEQWRTVAGPFGKEHRELVGMTITATDSGYGLLLELESRFRLGTIDSFREWHKWGIDAA